MNHLIKEFSEEYQDYLRDESRSEGKAESISFPKTEEEIIAIVRDLYQAGIPFTLQGARTGLAASAVPQGGHILNLSRMNNILGARYDEKEDAFFLLTEPGILLSQLRKAILNKDFQAQNWSEESKAALSHFKPGEWFFTPDPTETSAALGGMAACNASGARSFFYGAIRPWIEALRLVLPDGRTAALRRGQYQARGREFALPLENGETLSGLLPDYQMPAVKNASGYYIHPDMDLLDLFIGSEGTLGIITQMEVRLIRKPQAMWGISAFLPEQAMALKYVQALRGEVLPGLKPFPHQPVSIEFFNCNALDLLRRQKEEGSAFSQLQDLPEDFHTAVYAEFHESSREKMLEILSDLGDLLAALGSREENTWVAANPRDMEELHLFRHAIPESVNMLVDEKRRDNPALTKLGSDMAIPDEYLEWVMALYHEDLEKNGFEYFIFGHIGNNHLHCNIIPRNNEEYVLGKEVYKSWAREITRRGGTVSAEHGVGKLKAPFLEIMYGEQGIAEMRKLKLLFDPKNLLNPGNMFTI